MAAKRSLLLNVFSPAMAAVLPSRFAGRQPYVARLTDALHIHGSCPVIYGDRGVGKTSLAVQMERIALGDVELLQHLGLDDHVIAQDEAFATIRISCTDQIRHVNGILQTIINNAEGFASHEDLPQRLMVRGVKHTLKLKVYEAELSKQYKSIDRKRYSKLSTEEQLAAVLDLVCERVNRKVLCIIDELDRVNNTSGLASFIKSYSDENRKFLLIGVGGSLSSLYRSRFIGQVGGLIRPPFS